MVKLRLSISFYGFLSKPNIEGICYPFLFCFIRFCIYLKLFNDLISFDLRFFRFQFSFHFIFSSLSSLMLPNFSTFYSTLSSFLQGSTKCVSWNVRSRRLHLYSEWALGRLGRALLEPILICKVREGKGRKGVMKTE